LNVVNSTTIKVNFKDDSSTEDFFKIERSNVYER
jgi:hypothetical protein